jgi:aspartate kinase
MGIIVQKYGGSSLADPEKIKSVARNVVNYYHKGHQMVIVVSAMGHTTDELLELAYSVCKNPPKRELDMLLSTGERMSIALLAMAIHDLGVEAVSFTGSQVGIITDSKHTQARILEVKALRIPEALEAGKIVIVAGFQGVSVDKEITTLGRGGSDATAVALAAALKADECQIMKDVDGVFIADPKKIQKVRLTPELSYDEMLEMAELGAEVINHYAVEIAKHYKVKISVGNTFSRSIGTIITDRSFDTAKVSGIVEKSEVIGIKLSAGNDHSIWEFQKLLEANRWKTYYSYFSENVFWAILDKAHTREIESLLKKPVNGNSPEIFKDIALISIIGSGLNYSSPLVQKILKKLESWQSSILSFQATIQKISIILKGKQNSRQVINEIYEEIFN